MFSYQTIFLECEHLSFDKSTVKTEFAVPSARLVDMLSKLYRSNMQRMLIKNDLTRFMQSLSRVRHKNFRKLCTVSFFLLPAKRSSSHL